MVPASSHFSEILWKKVKTSTLVINRDIRPTRFQTWAFSAGHGQYRKNGNVPSFYIHEGCNLRFDHYFDLNITLKKIRFVYFLAVSKIIETSFN